MEGRSKKEKISGGEATAHRGDGAGATPPLAVHPSLLIHAAVPSLLQFAQFTVLYWLC